MSMNQIEVISSYINHGEVKISHEEEFRTVLSDLLQHGNSVILLKFPHLGVLTIGIGTPYGFVEYMNENGSPPYLIATNAPNFEVEESFVEFDSGGTLTPIPIQNCLPFDRVEEIVLYFLRNKKLPDYITWKEV
jgi:hypothetical protein